MFNTQKKVFVIAVAVCLIAILSFGTLAWFNANDSITNTFLMTNSDGDETPDFTVEVWETENDGDPDADQDNDGDNNITHGGNTYEELAPGDVIAKDPTVENTGDYSQWIRVYVTFTNHDVLANACEAYDEVDDLPINMLDIDYTKWTYDSYENGTYLFYLNDVLDPTEVATLFNNVTIPSAFQMEDLVELTDDKFEITVKAEAIQSKNTEDTAKESFELYWNPEYSVEA